MWHERAAGARNFVFLGFCYSCGALNPTYPRVASLKTAQALRAHLQNHDISLPFDNERSTTGESPLAQPIEVDGVRVGNRFCILPMEGWDGTRDGEPSDLTRRRWRNFGTSGAKLMWGGEAVAVKVTRARTPISC